MALMFVDGFDHYNIGDILTKWSGITNSGTMYMGTGRYGGQAVLTAHYGSSFCLYKNFTSQTTMVVGFAVLLNTTGSGNDNMLKLAAPGGAEQFSVLVLSTGYLGFGYAGSPLSATSGSGYSTIAIGSWNFIEVEFEVSSSVTAGSCKIYVNSVLYSTLNTGQSTNNAGGGYVGQLELWNASNYAPSNPRYYDDVYILNIDGDTTGPYGDCRVETLYPSGAGSNTQWTPLSGANYSQVDEVHFDGDTSYISSDTTGDLDTYVFNSLSGTPSSIYGVQSTIMLRKDDTSTRAVEATIYIDSTAYVGSPTSTIASTYAAFITIFETDPSTSAPWTTLGVDNAEYGVTLST